MGPPRLRHRQRRQPRLRRLGGRPALLGDARGAGWPRLCRADRRAAVVLGACGPRGKLVAGHGAVVYCEGTAAASDMHRADGGAERSAEGERGAWGD